jgi:hypothetical protein
MGDRDNRGSTRGAGRVAVEMVEVLGVGSWDRPAGPGLDLQSTPADSGDYFCTD